jgi:hypothetical protein
VTDATMNTDASMMPVDQDPLELDATLTVDAGVEVIECVPGAIQLNHIDMVCTCWTDRRWRCVDQQAMACRSASLSSGEEPIQPCFDHDVLLPICRLLSIETDNGEGTPIIFRNNFIYDDAGYLIGETFEGVEDPSIKSSVNFTYNSSRRIASMERRASFTKTTYFTYNDNGWLAERYDQLANNEPDVFRNAYTYTYNGNGNRVQVDHNPIGDDTITSRWIYGYDDDGWLISETLDTGADGMIEHQVEYAYDDQGRLIRDGVTYIYDDDGLPTRRDTDVNGDGVAEHRINYAYDPDNGLITKETDNMADGTVDYTSTYTYTPDTRTWTAVENMSADNMLGTRTFFVFDIEGNLVIKKSDTAGDGTLIHRRVNAFDCTPR